MMKNLILYYSRKEKTTRAAPSSAWKGQHGRVAEAIQQAVGGDLFELETVKSYAVGYDQCIAEAKAELQENARPQLKRYWKSLDGYGNVFVCGPCWWGRSLRGVQPD